MVTTQAVVYEKVFHDVCSLAPESLVISLAASLVAVALNPNMETPFGFQLNRELHETGLGSEGQVAAVVSEENREALLNERSVGTPN